MYFRDLFFNYEIGERNKIIVMTGCQVNYIPNFTTNLKYLRNGEMRGNDP